MARHNFRCLVLLLRAENINHVVAAGVHRDDIICDDVIKMSVLAHSALSPGYSTMITNMATCLVHRPEEDDDVPKSVTSWIQRYMESKVQGKNHVTEPFDENYHDVCTRQVVLTS